jgi:hypothetical protein
VFSHTSNPVNIDKIPPTATLSNPAYVNAYSGFPSSGVMFPPVTRFNDFALTISDNQAVQSVSATIQYWNDNGPSALVGNVSPTQAYTPPAGTSPSSNNGVSEIQVPLNDIQQLSANKNLDTALSEAKNYGFTGSDDDLLQQLKKYYCNYPYTSSQKKLNGHCSSIQ